MSKCLPSSPPFCPIYSVQPQAGGSEGGMGQRGGFSRCRGEGELLPALPLAAPRRFHSATWLTQRSRLFSKDETVPFPSFSRSLERGHPFGQCRACSPRAPGEAASRHSGRPVSPSQGQDKEHPLPFTVSGSPDRPAGATPRYPRASRRPARRVAAVCRWAK